MLWRCSNTKNRNEVKVVAKILRVAAKGSKEAEILIGDHCLRCFLSRAHRRARRVSNRNAADVFIPVLALVAI